LRGGPDRPFARGNPRGNLWFGFEPGVFLKRRIDKRGAGSSPRPEDAGNYITKLSKAEHEAAEWQAPIEALILVVGLGGQTMFARIGTMLALNRHVERVFNPDRKDPHWGRRKLARDR